MFFRSELKAGNPAVSLEIRGFPTPPHDGCGFISFPVPTGKRAAVHEQPLFFTTQYTVYFAGVNIFFNKNNTLSVKYYQLTPQSDCIQYVMPGSGFLLVIIRFYFTCV